MTTVQTTLRGGRERVNCDQRSAIPRCLVCQLSDKVTPSHIAHGFGKRVVVSHMLDLQTSCIAVLRTFLLLPMPALGFGQLLFILVKELGLAVSVTLRRTWHALETQVKPNLLLDDRQRLAVFF